MRPDEHKKKQRAEYKKKHGISNKKTASKERNEPVKDKNNTEAKDKEVLADTDEGDHAQFSRRKVASNWERYEDIEDTSDEEDSDTNIQKRGEDFSVLLQKSENPAAQFRFQSEKDWDQESDASTTQVSASALEIDFGALATSLNCIPLHKRLNISADQVHPDLVKEFEFNAELYRRDQSILTWSSTDKTNTKTTTTTTSRSTPYDTQQLPTLLHGTQNNQQNFIKKTHEQSTICSNDSKQATSSSKSDEDMLQPLRPGSAVEPSEPHNVEDLQTSLKDVLRTVNATSTNNTAGQVVESAKNEDDDELKFLLSLGTPGVSKNSGPSAALLSDKVNLSREVPSTENLSSGNQSANNADDDLEDWLDSVLG